MAVLYKTIFTFLLFAILQSCTGVFNTPRIEKINNTRDVFSKTQSEIEMKFGEPEIRFKGFSKENCIAYVGFFNDYADFCFASNDSVTSQGGGISFLKPDTIEDLYILDSNSYELSFMENYKKAFKQKGLSEGEIRIWIFPSFKKEILIKCTLKPNSINIFQPKSKSFWEDMTEVFPSGGGRIKMNEDYIPAEEILSLPINDNVDQLVKHLKSIDLTKLKSIRKRAFFRDGTSFIIEHKKNNIINIVSIRNIPWYNPEYDHINSLIDSAYTSFSK